MKSSHEDGRLRLLTSLVDEARDEGAGTITLRALVEEASEEGACRALRRMGLHDEGAGEDIRELRDLLDAWRDAKRTAWRAFVRWLTTILILMLLAGLAMRVKLPFLDQ